MCVCVNCTHTESNNVYKCFTMSSQGLCFLPKIECDVRDVEVARAIRLGKSTIEPVAFRVPRVRVRHPHTTTRQHWPLVGIWRINSPRLKSTHIFFVYLLVWKLKNIINIILYFLIPLAQLFLSTFSALYCSVSHAKWTNVNIWICLHSTERVFPGWCIPWDCDVVGSISDRCCLALWIRRTAPQNQPAAQRHDAWYSSTSPNTIHRMPSQNCYVKTAIP